MGQRGVLFLGTANHHRCRVAEVVFNSVAGKMGLPWSATSRGLALEQGRKPKEPMAATAIAALHARGIRCDILPRNPIAVTLDDLQKANRIIALHQLEHAPLIQERFPEWIEKVEYWHIHPASDVVAALEREVMTLVSRLLGGAGLRDEPIPVDPEPTGRAAREPTKKRTTVRVGRETKGRRGKGVTTVSDVPLDEAGLLDLAAKLKQRCGTGGTVKDGRIEIQGDQRDRLVAELETLGYTVKRVGG